MEADLFSKLFTVPGEESKETYIPSWRLKFAFKKSLKYTNYNIN